MKAKSRKKQKNTRKLVLSVLFLLAVTTLYFGVNSKAKNSEISTQENSKKMQINYIDGSNSKESRIVKFLPLENGFIAVGSSYSLKEKMFDVYLVRFDKDGKILWEKRIGGSDDDYGFDVIESIEKDGFVIVGTTRSKEYKTKGSYDVLIMKINNLGELVWVSTFGGKDWERAYKIVYFDGGYALLGDNYLKDGDVSQNFGEHDFWVLKITKDGKLVWDKSFGETGWDRAYACDVLIDNENEILVVAGSTNSFKGKSELIYDTYIVFYDKNGEQLSSFPLSKKINKNSYLSYWPTDIKIRDGKIYLSGYLFNGRVESGFVAVIDPASNNDNTFFKEISISNNTTRVNSIFLDGTTVYFVGYSEENSMKKPLLGRFEPESGIVETSILSEEEYGIGFSITKLSENILIGGTKLISGSLKGFVKSVIFK